MKKTAKSIKGISSISGALATVVGIDQLELTRAALIGYQQQLRDVTAKIRELSRLAGSTDAIEEESVREWLDRRADAKKVRASKVTCKKVTVMPAIKKSAKKVVRALTAEGRDRIAKAQKKRWAAVRKAKRATAKAS